MQLVVNALIRAGHLALQNLRAINLNEVTLTFATLTQRRCIQRNTDMA